jgi:hypothetical protein
MHCFRWLPRLDPTPGPGFSKLLSALLEPSFREVDIDAAIGRPIEH